MNKELKDLMMYMIGFSPRLDNGEIFQEVYDDNRYCDRWNEKTVNELIDMVNRYYGLDIKYIEVKEE